MNSILLVIIGRLFLIFLVWVMGFLILILHLLIQFPWGWFNLSLRILRVFRDLNCIVLGLFLVLVLCRRHRSLP